MEQQGNGTRREQMTQALRLLHQRPIAYYPAYAQLLGSVTSGVYLSQVMYWWAAAGDDFYKTDAEMIQETYLSAGEIRTAKKQIKAMGCVAIKAKGVPPVTHYTVNIEQLFEKLASLPNFVKSTKLILSNQQNQNCEINKIDLVNLTKSFNERACVLDLGTEITSREEDSLPLGREDSTAVENDATAVVPAAHNGTTTATPPVQKTPTKTPQLWPEEDQAFAEWVTTQSLLTVITPPIDYDWWCDMSYVINGLPDIPWLERQYAKMQMWLRDNPRRKPTPKGTSRFVRNWLERTYNDERRQATTRPKEVHIHYDNGNRRR